MTRPEFYPVPGWALDLTGADGEERITTLDALFLGVISYYERLGDGAGAFPSRRTLAEDCRVDERTIAAVVKRLKTRGLLQVTHGNGRGRLTYYRVVGPRGKGDPSITVSGPPIHGKGDRPITLSTAPEPSKGDPPITLSAERVIGDDAERVIRDGSSPFKELELNGPDHARAREPHAGSSAEPLESAESFELSVADATPARRRGEVRSRTVKPPPTPAEQRMRALMTLARKHTEAAYQRNHEPFPGRRLAWNAAEWRDLAAFAQEAVTRAREIGRIYDPEAVLRALIDASVDEHRRKPVGFWRARIGDTWADIRNDKARVPFERITTPAHATGATV